MIRPVAGTVVSRVAIVAMNLLVVVVAGRALGTTGLGTISLLVLGITFILVLNNVVGGGGIVYLLPRHGAAALRWPSYAWALGTAAVARLVLHRWQLVPEGLADHTVALAFLQAIIGIHLAILLGRERIGVHNALLVFQAAALLLVFAVLVRHDTADVMDYVLAAYAAHGATALLSTIASIRHTADRRAIAPTGHPVVDLFRQGAIAQAANGMQLLNYRLAYYLIKRSIGIPAVGIYSVTSQLAESTWLVPKSLGLVLYARMSNTEGMERQRDLTLAVLKVALAVALLFTVVLVLLPDALYQLVFGPEVTGIAKLVLLLAPGLLAMAASQALSHYLSGTGRVWHNAIGSGLGAVATLALGFSLIPKYGLPGAAITASIAYCTSTLYQVVVFHRLTGARLRHFVPNAADVDRLRTLWNRLVGR
ncbi:MAG: polysaccharide biosynthesis C-terminal domain-containing protein [Flavobacteriales bacterium]